MDTIIIISGLAIVACFVFGPIVYLETRPEARELRRLSNELDRIVKASPVVEKIILPPSHFFSRLLLMLLLLTLFVWMSTSEMWVLGVFSSVLFSILIFWFIVLYLRGHFGIKITEEFLLVTLPNRDDSHRIYYWPNISTFVVVRKRRFLFFPVRRLGLVFEKNLREELRDELPKNEFGDLDYVLSSNLGMSAEDLADFLNTRLLRYTKHLR